MHSGKTLQALGKLHAASERTPRASRKGDPCTTRPGCRIAEYNLAVQGCESCWAPLSDLHRSGHYRGGEFSFEAIGFVEFDGGSIFAEHFERHRARAAFRFFGH